MKRRATARRRQWADQMARNHVATQGGSYDDLLIFYLFSDNGGPDYAVEPVGDSGPDYDVSDQSYEGSTESGYTGDSGYSSDPSPEPSYSSGSESSYDTSSSSGSDYGGGDFGGGGDSGGGSF